MEGSSYDRLGGMYEALLEGTAARRTGEVAGLLLKLLPAVVIDGGHLVNVVDLCCGTGHVSSRLRAAEGSGGPWWHVIGVDTSSVQLANAHHRLDEVKLASAAETGLPAGEAELVVCTYATTDVPDWPALVEEAARLLVPGGFFAVIAAHPCFAGPDSIPYAGGGQLQPGNSYSRTRFTREGRGFTPGGLRSQVGAWQRSLSTLFEPLCEPPWRLRAVREAAGDPPALLGFCATRD